MPAALSEPALLERDAERDELAALLGEAREGAGRLVVVEGAAGIGKTRLLRDAREAAEGAGMRVLAARGTELERDFPFAVARQLFEPVLAAAGEERRAELLAGAARPAAGIVAGAPDEAPADALVDPSFGTLTALYWLVSNLVEDEPALLVVDDVHWADEPSLRFLRFLVTRLEDLPVLLALAARPDEAGAHGELLAAIAADPAARLVRPRALSAAAVAELVRAALGSAAHDDFCAACGEASGGNPFLLRELLAELAAGGSAGTAAEAARVREIAPAAISRGVLLRLARLSDDARRLAWAVAVLGDDAELRHACTLAGLDRADAATAADALAAAGILEPARPLRFAHPLVRNAVHADLPAGERAAAHEGAARLLADDGAEPERVALHLLATEPASDPEVAETLLAAGQRASGRAAPEAAVRYLRRALLEAPSGELRQRIVRHLASAGFRAVDREALDGFDPVAEITAEPETLLASAVPVGMWLLAVGRLGEMAALFERSAAVAAERGDHDAAMRFAMLLVTWTHLPPREAAPRVAPYAERLAPDSPGERLWLALRAWWGSFSADMSSAEAADLAWRAVGSGEAFGEMLGLPTAPQAILVLIRAERHERAETALDRYEDAARERGSVADLAGAAFLRGGLALARGEIARSEAEARAAVEAGRQGGFLLAFPVWIALLVDTLVERGELDAAEAALEDNGLTGATPTSYWFTPILFARGHLRLAQGRPREAVDDLLAGAREAEALGMVNNYEPWAANAALGLLALGAREQARALLDGALPVAQAWGAGGLLTAWRRTSGLVTGGHEGLRELAEAAAGATGLERIRALVEHGAALRRANRRADAREPLHTALDVARRGGALALARRAHEELAATGERVRPLEAAGVEALTPSERRVAALAAEGRSNREIAQALFLTVKTVETHLSNAYRKLDIRSRRELGDALGD